MRGSTVTKITYEGIKHFLTAEQREKYELSPDKYFKECIDKGIRNANRTNFMSGIPYRAQKMQTAYQVLETLSCDQVETLKTLPARVKEANEYLTDYERKGALRRIERDMPVTTGFAFEPALTVLKDYNKHLFEDLL